MRDTGLQRSASVPELKSAASNPQTERSKAVDFLQQSLKQDKQKEREPQEAFLSSSHSHQADILRSTRLERQMDDQTTASSSPADRNGFGVALGFERERLERTDTHRASQDIPMSTFARYDSGEQRPLTTQDLRRLEEGLRDTVRDTVQEELRREHNRPRTWREWANNDFNTIVSTIGTAGVVLTAAGFVYTYRPDLIPHH